MHYVRLELFPCPHMELFLVYFYSLWRPPSTVWLYLNLPNWSPTERHLRLFAIFCYYFLFKFNQQSFAIKLCFEQWLGKNILHVCRGISGVNLQKQKSFRKRRAESECKHFSFLTGISKSPPHRGHSNLQTRRGFPHISDKTVRIFANLICKK